MTIGEADAADCLQQLRTDDYDRYLCTVLAPPSQRAGLAALYALNLDVAKIREQVHEPMLGQIRLQWWREAVDELKAGRPRSQPALRVLAQTGAAATLDIGVLQKLLDAREQDFRPEALATLSDLVTYAADTGGALQRLALGLLGESEPEVTTAGEAVGTAWALIGLVRAVPFHVASGRPVLAQDLVLRAGLAVSDIAPGSAALSRAVAEVMAVATPMLRQGRMVRAPRQALPVMMLGRLARQYARAIERAGYDPFAPQLALSPLRRQWSVVLGAMMGRG
ncbi:MAG: hypothetical protein FJX65_09605 [Alphaproteobacteria bacterium]|nr:hypothetical protein [Alphaproteobacteria bacterium]